MPRPVAVIDTSVLADASLKGSELRAEYEAASKRLGTRKIPYYVLKEYKSGPIGQFVGLYNNVVDYGLEGAISRIRGSLPRQQNRPKGQLEFFEIYCDHFIQLHQKRRFEMEGDTASDFGRCELLMRIMSAWHSRKDLIDEIEWPLPCYGDIDLTFDERHGKINPGHYACDLKSGTACSMRQYLLEERRSDTIALSEQARVEAKGKNRNSVGKSNRILKDVLDERRAFTSSMCRNLGDAAIALYTRESEQLITQNIRHFEPLCVALNRKAPMRPDEVIKGESID